MNYYPHPLHPPPTAPPCDEYPKLGAGFEEPSSGLLDRQTDRLTDTCAGTRTFATTKARASTRVQTRVHGCTDMAGAQGDRTRRVRTCVRDACAGGGAASGAPRGSAGPDHVPSLLQYMICKHMI